jgi:anti-sigma factor RsiW
MTCRELNDVLAEYLDRALPPADRARLEAHLVDCGACVAYVRSYLATVRAAKATGEGADVMPAVRGPEDLVEAILDATVRAAPESGPRGR